MKDDKIDHICRLLGVGLKPFHEFVPENIKCFNDCIPERSNIDVLMQLSQVLLDWFREVAHRLHTFSARIWPLPTVQN
jgi:hypothetical protein